MNILITGANGFIAKNLFLALQERGFTAITKITRETSDNDLKVSLACSDVIFHLAGEMRASEDNKFVVGNVSTTKRICKYVAEAKRPVKIIYASTISVVTKPDSVYARTKLEAEALLSNLARTENVQVSIFRLPHIFGKWARPFYNSIIATACYSLANNKQLNIFNPDTVIYPLYIDNLINCFCKEISIDNNGGFAYRNAGEPHQITVGDVVQLISTFAKRSVSFEIPEVGAGFVRELYATYISYLPEQCFSYALPMHSDSRGFFVEFLKTQSSGQFSYFTANPGVSRGNHYHHTKSEKFLVVQGSARFVFQNLINDNLSQIDVSADKPTVVDSIPGWAHNITNIGSEKLIVLLWSNEIFDKEKPDTFSFSLSK